jgi:hypothetical protein
VLSNAAFCRVQIEKSAAALKIADFLLVLRAHPAEITALSTPPLPALI